MALVDPNIAMGYRGIQLEQRNPLQEYAQVQQIQTAQLQNQLARQQMEQEQGVVNYLGKANLATPEGRAGLRQFGKVGLGYEKLLSEQEMNDLKRKELEGKVRDQRMTALGTGLTSVLKDPSDANLTAAFDRLDATGVDTKPFRASLLSEPDPLKRQATITQYVTSNPEGRQALTFVQPKPEKIDLNGKIVTVDMNPNSPTYKQQIQEFTKTATIADQLAREKFSWEKANPNQTIYEDANGLLAVNNRTGVATPVVYGPMGIQPAATAAPGASIMRQPPAALPSQRAPAIPGMASVLDQTNAPAMPMPAEGNLRVPGMPVGGKDKNLTESQGAAAAYGMRMKEANSILAPLEKSGVKNTGLISGTVGGVVGLVPLIGDKLESATGSVFNSLPQILGGLSPEQQQVAQARINFITAVLRKESGASISPAEFSTAEKNYFPKPGDDASTIAQKQKARQTAIKAMEVQAGPGAKYIQQHQPSVGAAPTVSNW